MYVADSGIPNNGVITAEIEGLPENPALNAKWHIMRPMQARGWTPEGNGPRIELDTPLEISGKIGKTSKQIEIEDDEALIASLALYLPTGELFWLSEDLTLKKEHTIGGPGCEFNYYTTEEKINVRILLKKYAE